MARLGLAVVQKNMGDERGRAISPLPDGDHPRPTFFEAALADAASPSDGWLLPLEPLLRVHSAPEVWAPVLARLRARAA